MVLYDAFIDRLNELTADKRQLPVVQNTLADAGKNDILFAKETAFELGGSQKPCVSTLAVSSTREFSNRAYLVGRDLTEIKNDCAFGKIIFAQIEEQGDDEAAFNTIKELEQIKYRIYVQDFMTRASALNMREQIRVGKNAVKNKVGFADYGKKLISAYLQNNKVKSIDVIFITDFDDFAQLNSIAEKIKQTTSALNHIMDNILLDCSSCNLKPICDEVEGMRELHQKRM